MDKGHTGIFDDRISRAAITQVLRQVRCHVNLELCVSIQIQYWQTVLCSEVHPNANRQNVGRNPNSLLHHPICKGRPD
jgi:hypothetical protein